jgi:hypothetical protein
MKGVRSAMAASSATLGGGDGWDATGWVSSLITLLLRIRCRALESGREIHSR